MIDRFWITAVRGLCRAAGGLGLLIGFLVGGLPAVAGAADIDFAQDVQPILRRHCFRCHGTKNQEAGLQLNHRASALGESESGEPLVAKGDPDGSLLIQRITSADVDEVMPPDGKPLSSDEVEILRQWIAEGAAWPEALAAASHWAYRPIKRPTVPDLKSSAAPIDQFVERGLRKRGLTATEPADPARLIRRLSLALTGVPPTIDEVETFRDHEPERAIEQVVDRLLQSQRFGERWAVPWLDLARYADSNGFQADQIRDNWAYRDWVIRAMNSDLAFDDFVIDQIAGDLRPQATADQRIATGFHRMTTCNVEAGVHPEANRTNQIVDRVNTTATVFLGTTMECAQCHDHKYDPFSQRDYYQLFAYFNNTPLEVKNTSGVTWDFYGPTMDLPESESTRSRRRQLESQLSELTSQREQRVAAADPVFARWLASVAAMNTGPSAWTSGPPEQFETSGGEAFEILSDGAVLLSGQVPDTAEYTFTFRPSAEPVAAIRVEALTDESIPGKGPGRGDAKKTNIILSEVTVQRIGDKETETLELTSATADYSQPGWSVERAIDGNRKTGWAIAPQFGKPHWAVFTLRKPIKLEPGSDVLRVTLGQHFGRGRVMGKPRVSLYSGDASLINVSEEIIELAAKVKLTARERKRLRSVFEQNDQRLRELDRAIAEASKQIDELKPDTTLVMVEMEQPRETFVMVRGDYESLSDQVSPAPPQVLSGAQAVPSTGDRLELARWLTSRENPLLARVTVNRWWAELFGRGLVATPEDFGSQGDSPSHPDLLDWLASELIESGWSRKHVIKQIVMSKTFQRSARANRQPVAIDPENRWLSRGPRFRVPAEFVRDNALAISGVLSTKMYGPPVMPHQPDNVWRSVGRNQPKWVVAQNEDRFRRGVYVICKRAAPYPSFINFDAPDRGSCTVKRSRSNTPLQALTLLNDPAYAELALAFADRVLADAPTERDADRIRFAFRLAVSREPNTYEISVLQDLLDNERGTLASNPDLVEQRTRVSYEGLALRSTDHNELAAWFAITNALLNMDETMTQ